MTHLITNRCQLIVGVGVLAVALTIAVTPAGRNAALAALADFAEIAERVARFPCWLANRSRCFSLDRLDPTCPQCI